MKWIILMLAAMVMTTAASATPFFMQNTPTSLSAGCYDEATGNYTPSYANITVYYPNQSVFINNQPMTNFTVGNGQFNFSLTTPNTTGLYSYVITCVKQSDSTRSMGMFTFEVKDLESDVGLAGIAVIIGLVALAAFCVYMGHHHMQRPDWNKVLAVAFYLTSSWCMTASVFVLYIQNIGTTLEVFLNGLYIATFWVVVGFNIAYLSITVIDIISTSLQGVSMRGKR